MSTKDLRTTQRRYGAGSASSSAPQEASLGQHPSRRDSLSKLNKVEVAGSTKSHEDGGAVEPKGATPAQYLEAQDLASVGFPIELIRPARILEVQDLA